ncbi:primosomal protein N' [Aestuariibacter sp. AA17]|uniref:Replication restart protein PriA n=1 Tax=Fluctibacter corallii TaxID=2984329 RepID=A0ABT3A6J1_9ALTE|nr:primosomal protein N' [Aestuariibacter sp. AA17]MCV2884305.1 primosomal protein N' [Aestuariibacter sp. AA17]
MTQPLLAEAHIIRVALPVPLRRTFEYLYDDQGGSASVQVGCRVVVPFGNRELIGVVTDTGCNPEHDVNKLKRVINVLDASPVIDEMMLSLCLWMSQYYYHSLGDVIATALPVAIRKGESQDPKPLVYLKATNVDEITVTESLKRAKAQRALWQRIVEKPVLLSELSAEVSRPVIQGLIQKKFAEEMAVIPSSDENWWALPADLNKPFANVQQAAAISAINATTNFSVHLLEGVTGSGKTEVYLQCIEPVLRQKKQVLMLVPEIGLTPQTVSRFEQRFGCRVGVLHSNLNDNERLLVWQQSLRKELGIVIGTRSAIFTPMPALGMVIVDEEHDSSFKQQDGLRYHARDVAIMRAKQQNIPVLLGSATPSLESLNNALQQRFSHHILSERAGSATHAQQHVLDITNQPLIAGLSHGMLDRIRMHLSQGNQVLLFINRRGFAPALLCHACGHVETCTRCNKPFTLHKQLNKIQCHHCSSARPVPPRCSQCGDTDIEPFGVGTEQLEQALTEQFPEHPPLRIDSDSTRGKNKLQTLLDKVNHGEHSLLVGTQILSKGHHFPNVTLVVILGADGALFSADFRASEHLAQLITQLAGRAGRADKPGEMWLQTHQPGHPLIQDLIHNGYGHFARHALVERKHAALPPYHYQVLFRAEATNVHWVEAFLRDVRDCVSHSPSIMIIGPLPAIMEKRQGRFRMQLLLQSTHRGHLQRAIGARITDIEALASARRVRWSIDVDPQDFM